MYEHGGDIYNHVGCVDFSANINFLGMPKEVKEAVKESVNLCEHYPDTKMQELKAAISLRENVKTENIICSNGAAELIFALTAAVMPKKALLFAPGFQEYEQALLFYKCDIHYHMLLAENEFKLDCADRFLEEVKKQKYDMIFLCNPNNPTGILTKKHFIKALLDICNKNKTLLMVDECFLDFIENKNEYSVVDLLNSYDNLFILKAFTKMFAMPGLRLGYGLCANEKLLQKIKQGIQPWNVSVAAQKAGSAAANLYEFEERTRKLLKIEKEFLLSVLKQADYKVYGSAANYIFFRADESLVENLLKKNIYIRDCSNYKGLEKGYYRIAVRTHEENEKFAQAVRR